MKQNVYLDEEKKMISKLRRNQQPVLKPTLSAKEKQEIITEKILIIQKTWRMLKVLKMFNTKLVASKKPIMKVYTIFRNFESKSTRIVVLYDRYQKKFLINLAIYEVDGAAPKCSQATISIEPILQYVYANEDWSQKIKDDANFMNYVLPQLSRAVAKSIEVFTSSDEPGLLCRINLETSQRVSLIEKEDRYNKDKDKKIKLKEEVSLDKLTEYVIKIQRKIRKDNRKLKNNQLISLVKRVEQVRKNMGELIKSTFRRVSDDYYRIRIYSKMHSNEEYYNFFITPAPGSQAQKDLRFMLSYRVSENKLINCHGQELVEYLLNLMRKDPDQYKFYFQRIETHFEVIQQKSKFLGEVIEEDDQELEDSNTEGEATTFDTVDCNHPDQVICFERRYH